VVSVLSIGGACAFSILLKGSVVRWFCTIPECIVLQFLFIASSVTVLWLGVCSACSVVVVKDGLFSVTSIGRRDWQIV